METEFSKLDLDSLLDTTPDLPEVFWPYAKPVTSEKAGKQIEILIITPHHENTAAMCTANKIKPHYNEMNHQLTIDIPGLQDDRSVDDKITFIKDLMGLYSYQAKTYAADHVSLIAARHHPVREIFDTVKWDGVSRFGDLCATLKTNNPVDSGEHPMKKLIIKGILVLSGRQGLEKTTWFRRLCEPFKDAFLEGSILIPSSKDSVIVNTGFWIVELGEVGATIRKADVEELKSFLTRDKDTLRLPYARHPVTVKRRTVYCATVNDDRFLIDEENRRYWVLSIDDIDYSAEIDMLQLWAEVKTWYSAGEKWYLTRAELQKLHEINSGHRLLDPIEELLESNVVKPDLNNEQSLNATRILMELGIKEPKKIQTNIAARWLRRNGFCYRKDNRTYKVRISPNQPWFQNI